MDPTIIPNEMHPSENGMRFHNTWYNVICTHLRSMLSSTFQRQKMRTCSLASVSNPSIVTAEDSIEEVEELSPSEQFSWARMGNIFSEYQISYVEPGEELSLESLQITRRIFDSLLLDEDRYAELIFESIQKLDKTYAERFFFHSQLPKIRPREHMARHLKKIIEFHRLMLVAFEDDRTKALQIINLLALSHTLMNITITDFRIFDLAIGKFLYRIEKLDETNVHHVVGYMSTVTIHIERLLRRHNLENRRRELMLMDTKDFLLDINSVSRENYRELKKWYHIQMILRKSVADREDEHQREAVSTFKVYRSESQSSEMIKPIAIYSDEFEGWFIELLKRGYKYKTYDKSD